VNSTAYTVLDEQYQLTEGTAIIVTDDSPLPACFSYANETSLCRPDNFFQLPLPTAPAQAHRAIYLFALPNAPLLQTLNFARQLLVADGVVLVPAQKQRQYPHFSALATRLGYACAEISSRQSDYMVLSQQKTANWQLSFAAPQQQDNIRSLFLQVFQHPMSEKLWHWKYAQGRGHAALGWKDQQLVAHYGGIRRDIYIANQAATALQIGDVMVKSSERGVLTRKGLFFQLCATFLEQYIGDGKPYQLGYGFPTRRAMDVAQHQGLYRQVDHMQEKQWPALQTRASLFSSCAKLTAATGIRTQAKVNQLWQCMLQDFNHAIIGVRDWHYLAHRYLAHPQKDYQLYLVSHRFTRQPLGVIVLSIEQSRCRLMDIVASTTHFAMLIHHARRLTHQFGAEQLFGWVTHSHQQHWPSEQEQALDMCIPTNTWTTSDQADQQQHSWWLTAGDTDFC